MNVILAWILLFLSCFSQEGKPSPEQPRSQTPSVENPAVVDPITIAQVPIADVRKAYQDYLKQMRLIAQAAKDAGDTETAKQAEALIKIFVDRFTPAETSEMNKEGSVKELFHDQHDAGKFAFTLITSETARTWGVTAIWEPSALTVSVSQNLTPSPLSAAVLFHELFHVLHDLPALEGTGDQPSYEDREQGGQRLEGKLLAAWSKGTYRDLVKGEITKEVAGNNSRLQKDASWCPVHPFPEDLYRMFIADRRERHENVDLRNALFLQASFDLCDGLTEFVRSPKVRMERKKVLYQSLIRSGNEMNTESLLIAAHQMYPSDEE